MSFKDKPKRGGQKPFEREIKPRSNPKPKAAEAAPVKKAPRKLPAAPATVEAEGKPERISKILARVGVASRRDIERMIMEGRVTLNGKLLETPVVNVTFEDKIEVDGVPIRGVERTRLWLYHKPGGLVTTNSDPEGRPTVFENLPEDLPRVLSIGRLDINTEGLLLLTNDGGLSRVLELPTTGWLRRYRVRAHGEVDQAKLDALKDGIAVDGVLYGSIEATLDRAQGRNVWITMGLREGKNREIKNVLGALGLEVNRLIRVSYGPFQLGDLEEGRVIEVKGRMLRDQLGPRLIADAKANFDAPIYGNAVDAEEAPAPARGARPERSERPERAERNERPERAERSERSGWGQEKPAERRSDDRFGDKPRGPKAGGDRGPKSFGNKGPARGGFADRGRDGEGEERPKKRPALGTSRTANVWMAPGARPTTDERGRKISARSEAEQLFKKPAPQNDRPIVINRVEGDSDWIRADSPPEPERGDKRGGFGDRGDRGDRGFGDKPRGERSFGDKPRGDRSFGDKPRGERSFGDKPRGDRPFSDRPRGDRPARDGERSFDKPRGDRSFGDKPRGDRPAGDRPRSDRPYGDKPRGERSFGDKPRFDRKPREEGDRPRSDRPYGDRPQGDRPRAERPFGDKPRGDRPFSDRPRGDRPDRGGSDRGDRPARSFGGEGRSERPAGDRPYGDRPQGDRPRGGKPGGFGGGKPGFGGKPSGGRGKPGGGKPGGGKSFGGKPSGGKPGAPRSGGRPAGGKPRTPRG
ncbi:pseudouridine synthase [Rhizobiales bacterium RZME27]|uniref:Pseudouridine synthase n=1 Tax=Endobacterium cereale TaxID=2663029 RepID=A0A6A8A8V9_9HYPH|nr:pseudouridine synthase [Endobacterium cereale]MEB2846876.1 pseudouridine synthase [Endobacterium cereale]MQY47705.1 pseudouridine synthase [Endobacterium cereale]